MAVSEKAKEKLDEASREIKEALESLRQEVGELTKKVREKIKGTGEEMRESSEALTREIKGLSERVRELTPKKRKKDRLPAVRVGRHPENQSDAWEQPFLELRRATDRLFDDFFRGVRWPLAGWRSPGALTTDISLADWPRADMEETDEEIRITADLPGVDRDDIEVSVSDDRISIRGEKKEQEERTQKGYYRFERSYGSFHRSFYLPCEVESDQVDAAFKDGVLTVTLPKSVEARERIKKIPVRNG